MSGHLHVIGGDKERNKRMNKEREKMVHDGAASYVAECPGASASPHILPMFEMDMRVRRQPGRIGMIRWVWLGRVFFLFPIRSLTGHFRGHIRDGLRCPAADVLTL